MPRNFILHRHDVMAIASLTNVAEGVKTVTPILHAVSLTVQPDGTWTALATDRYIVAEIGGQAQRVEGFEEAETFLLQASDWTRVLKGMDRDSMTAHFAPAAVEEEKALPEVRVSSDGATWTLSQVVGNFPPVARLFPPVDALAGSNTLQVDLDHLTRLSKVLTPEIAGVRATAKRKELAAKVRIQFAEGVSKPMLVTRDHTLGDFRAIAQPLLTLR